MKKPTEGYFTLSIGALMIIAGLVFAFMLLSVVFDTISGDAKIAVGLFTVAGTLVAKLVLDNKDHRRSIESHYRDRKTKMYNDYLNVVWDMFLQRKALSQSKIMEFHKKWHGDLIFWGGPSVAKTYIKWKAKLVSGADNPDEHDAELVFMLWDLVLEMRKDLGLSNKGLDRKTFTPLLLNDASKLLDAAETDPNVKLSDLQ